VTTEPEGGPGAASLAGTGSSALVPEARPHPDHPTGGSRAGTEPSPAADALPPAAGGGPRGAAEADPVDVAGGPRVGPEPDPLAAAPATAATAAAAQPAAAPSPSPADDPATADPTVPRWRLATTAPVEPLDDAAWAIVVALAGAATEAELVDRLGWPAIRAEIVLRALEARGVVVAAGQTAPIAGVAP
jgi:hypothetical protein